MKSKKVFFGALIIVLVIFASYGLLVVGDYIGRAADTHAGRAGNIYELVITHRVPVTEWSGIYGVAVRVAGYFNQQSESINGGSTEETNLLFDCIQAGIENEVYASIALPADIDWNSIQAATPAQVDAYLSKATTDFDSATNTFTQVVTVEIGSQLVSAPAVYTYKENEGTPATYSTALLRDGSGNILYVSKLTNFTQGFNGRTYNYQMLLPVAGNTTPEYYFYTDPFDECPEGVGTEPPTSLVIGNVSDTAGNRIEGVIVDVAGESALSDATGFYSVEPSTGQHYIIAIKEGYEVYQSNLSVFSNTTTVHDIILIEQVETNPATGVGSGVGTGTGPGTGPGEDDPGDSTSTGEGPGEIPPIPFVEQPTQIEGTDYIISLNELKRKIRPGEFLQESIYIFSFKKETITVTFEIEGTAFDLIDFDTQTLVLEPNSNGNVVLTIFGRAPEGVYNGTLKIDGDINASVPVVIEIVSKNKLPVEALQMDIETARKEVLPGDALKFKTDLRNLLIEHPYAVTLLYTIQPAEGGEVVWSETSNTYLQTAFSIIHTAKLPNDLPPGDYILRATASYLGLTSGSSTLFSVTVPFWQRMLFGLRYWHWLLILLAILLLGGSGYWYYRRQQAKKKFHLKVEYSELPQPGPRSIYVGKIAETDHKTYFNLESFKTHTIVAGSTGGGKSVSAQVVIEEALEKDVAVIAFDPTAQWTGMLRPCKDKTMLNLYPLFGMKKTDARAFNGNVRMILDAREKIDIQKYVKPGEIQVFCFHKLNPKDMDIVVANAIRSIFASGPQESKPLKIMFVFDEVHRLLPKFGGSGDGFLQIERGCREFRKWGMGIMLISQVLSDFVGTIKANINTEIQMRTRDEGDLERIRQKYGEDVLRSLVKATVGSGMVENPAYNRGQPYFVAFKPLKHSVERMSDDEIQQYNDYNDKMDNLFFSLNQLEEAGVDVFDLRLELKLALDKVKAGNFNMVDVYLEGLVPRIDKQWDALGKKPKQFERELVDLSEIKAELDKAKSERDKYEAENKKESGGDASEKKEIGWNDDVTPDKMLNLVNGMIVINLSSLFDELTAMKDDDLEKHFVPEQKNDFAQWVMNVVGDTKLAYNLYTAKTKDEMLASLQLKKDGKDIPDAKPPAWLAGATKPAAPNTPSAPSPKAQEPAQEDLAKEAQPIATQPTELSGAASAANESSAPTANALPPTQESPATEAASAPAETAQPPKQSAPIPPAPAQTQSSEDAFKQYSKEPAEQPHGKWDHLIADPSKAFKLEDGTALTSVLELKEYLPGMPEDIFSKHVGQDYNHFADWVNGVFHDEGLASKIREAHSKEDLLALLG